MELEDPCYYWDGVHWWDWGWPGGDCWDDVRWEFHCTSCTYVSGFFMSLNWKNCINVKDIGCLQVLEHHWDSLEQARVEDPVRLSGTVYQYLYNAHDSLKTKWNAPDCGSISFLYLSPVTQSGRPITGFVRPGTQSGRPGTMEQAIKTPRTASTARPVTSASGRFIRLGTVSKWVWKSQFAA